MIADVFQNIRGGKSKSIEALTGSDIALSSLGSGPIDFWLTV